MFPAPTTSAISTPRFATPCTWPAMRSTRSGSVPYSRPPIRASPDSFSSTRLNAGSSATARTSYALFPDHKPGEAGDPHVLAGPRRDLGAQFLDRLAVVGVGPNMFLLQQCSLLRPLLKLAVDDLRHDVVRLAFLAGLRLEHPALGLPCLLGDLLRRDDQRRRRSARDVNRDLARELFELVAAGDEVRLALDLHQHAHLPGRVDVGRHDALGGGSPASLGGRRLPLHAKDLDRLVDVALRLPEGGLAVHDPGAGAVPELLDVRRLDLVAVGTHELGSWPASAGAASLLSAAAAAALAASAASFLACSSASRRWRSSSSRLRRSASSAWRSASALR